MTDFEPLLNRWQSAGVLDAEAARRIRTYELAQTRPAGLRWQGMVALILFAICLPFVPLGAALMTFVASFTRSYREAQTYLTGVLLIPTLPIAFASIYSLKTQSSLMFIPSLSQHLLMTSVLKDEAVAVLDVWVSGAASLAVALVLIVLTARHWRRETMLG